MDEFLIIEAAAADASPKVMGLAYSGGKMTLPGWRHPVVVDLAGMEIPESVPLLTNHENRTGSRVGVVQAKVEGDGLVIEGEILSTSGQAQGIVEQAKAGADWQLSIGAEVLESELVRTRRLVNGRMQTGPFYHVRKSVLREVSVVAVGADMGTRMRVAARGQLLAASFNLYGGKTMEFEQWLKEHGIEAEGLDEDRKAKLKAAFEAGEEPPAGGAAEGARAQARRQEGAGRRAGANAAVQAVADARAEAESAIGAERERVAAIQDICAGEFPRIERDAIRSGWTVEETSQKVLKAMRESRPQADVNISVSRDRGRELRHQGPGGRPLPEGRHRRQVAGQVLRRAGGRGRLPRPRHQPPAALHGVRPHRGRAWCRAPSATTPSARPSARSACRASSTTSPTRSCSAASRASPSSPRASARRAS